MSKEHVVALFAKASENSKLKTKLEAASGFDDLVALGKEQGLEFSSEEVKLAIADLANRPSFFGNLVQAVLEIFSPNSDDYPASGVQPFSGEPNRDN